MDLPDNLGGGNRSGDGAGNKGGGVRDGDKGNRAGDRDRTAGDKARAGRDGDFKWPDIGDRDRKRGGGGHGHHRPPPCPRGHRDCHRSCCNRYGYGGYGYPWWGWGGGGWYDPYDPGRDYDRDSDREKRGAGQGNVELKLSPKDVEVYVNGILYSTKGNTKISLPVGTWTIEIRAEGYITETIELQIKQGDKYKIERKLQRDPNYRPFERDPNREERRSDA